jgi:DNA-binding LytR/AlgR family response regulator
MKYKCLIIDDEPIAIRVIQNHLVHFPDFEVTGTCANAIEAIGFMGKHTIDLIFLDVQMPQLTGIEWLKTVKNPPDVIITTAYRDFAVDAFELEVLDYLMKPISLSRFSKAITRFYQQTTGCLNPNIIKTIASGPDFLLIKADKKIIKVALSEIVFIESLGDYVNIHTSNGRITTKERISTLEEKLSGNRFLRIHRSYIVSIKEIRAFLGGCIEIAGRQLPIGRNYKEKVNTFLEQSNG